jgi:hypothetical protein
MYKFGVGVVMVVVLIALVVVVVGVLGEKIGFVGDGVSTTPINGADNPPGQVVEPGIRFPYAADPDSCAAWCNDPYGNFYNFGVFDCSSAAMLFCGFYDDPKDDITTCWKFFLGCGWGHLVNILAWGDKWCAFDATVGRMVYCWPKTANNPEEQQWPPPGLKKRLEKLYIACQDFNIVIGTMYPGDADVPNVIPPWQNSPYCAEICPAMELQGLNCFFEACYDLEGSGIVGSVCSEGELYSACKGDEGGWVPIYCCGGQWVSDIDQCGDCSSLYGTPCELEGNENGQVCEFANNDLPLTYYCCDENGDGEDEWSPFCEGECETLKNEITEGSEDIQNPPPGSPPPGPDVTQQLCEKCRRLHSLSKGDPQCEEDWDEVCHLCRDVIECPIDTDGDGEAENDYACASDEQAVE